MNTNEKGRKTRIACGENSRDKSKIKTLKTNNRQNKNKQNNEQKWPKHKWQKRNISYNNELL